MGPCQHGPLATSNGIRMGTPSATRHADTDTRGRATSKPTDSPSPRDRRRATMGRITSLTATRRKQPTSLTHRGLYRIPRCRGTTGQSFGGALTSLPAPVAAETAAGSRSPRRYMGGTHTSISSIRGTLGITKHASTRPRPSPETTTPGKISGTVHRGGSHLVLGAQEPSNTTRTSS